MAPSFSLAIIILALTEVAQGFPNRQYQVSRVYSDSNCSTLVFVDVNIPWYNNDDFCASQTFTCKEISEGSNEYGTTTCEDDPVIPEEEAVVFVTYEDGANCTSKVNQYRFFTVNDTTLGCTYYFCSDSKPMTINYCNPNATAVALDEGCIEPTMEGQAYARYICDLQPDQLAELEGCFARSQVCAGAKLAIGLGVGIPAALFAFVILPLIICCFCRIKKQTLTASTAIYLRRRFYIFLFLGIIPAGLAVGGYIPLGLLFYIEDPAPLGAVFALWTLLECFGIGCLALAIGFRCYYRKASAREKLNAPAKPNPPKKKPTKPAKGESNMELTVVHPWEFSPLLLKDQGWQSKANDSYSVFKLVDGDQVLHRDMLKNLLTMWNNFFQGSSFSIKSAYAVENATLKQPFEHTRNKLRMRAQQDADTFRQEDWQDDEAKVWVMDYCRNRINQFAHNLTGSPHVIPVLHGLRNEEACWSICQNGFATLSSLDSGYYGNGMYFTTSAKYAHDLYCNPENPVLLISWLVLANPFPATENPNGRDSLLGKPLKPRHDAHYVMVDRGGMPFARANVGSQPIYDEIVVVQESQILPAYVVFLNKKAVTSTQKPPQQIQQQPAQQPKHSSLQSELVNAEDRKDDTAKRNEPSSLSEHVTSSPVSDRFDSATDKAQRRTSDIKEEELQVFNVPDRGQTETPPLSRKTSGKSELERETITREPLNREPLDRETPGKSREPLSEEPLSREPLSREPLRLESLSEEEPLSRQPLSSDSDKSNGRASLKRDSFE
eukprot:TRINITY_DN4697_c0_g1_i1.p1 TRINITY_DN4697_c0_g1~~TRINITY_DN4697_c0_g1_i1.p1  ORF type:complete len:778 (+),score=148.97 TRINITY_DN4697_c0_g1_i1:81-2414(+)